MGADILVGYRLLIQSFSAEIINIILAVRTRKFAIIWLLLVLSYHYCK